MKFNEVVGHSDLKVKLINNVRNGRISHALLFNGYEGAGTLPMALALVQYLCCENKLETDSCGECNSCKKHQKFIHPDVHFIMPTNKIEKKEALSKEFMVEWRTFLNNSPYQNLFEWINFIEIGQKQGSINVEESDEIIKKLSLRPYEAEYKMIIIWMAEKMNVQAANKLLKILEEPEGKTLFILITENLDELLTTIISRTQLVTVPPVNDDEITSYLISKYALDNIKAQEIATISNGNVSAAFQLQAHSEEGQFSNFEMYKSWMRFCYSQKIKELLSWTDELVSVGRERQKSFLQYSLQLLRNNLAITIGANETVKISINEMEFSSKFHQFIHEKNAVKIYDDISKALVDIERNLNSKIVIFDLSLRLCGHLRIAR